MTLPKALRHVQTQHGDATVDVENIFLLSANLSGTSNAAGSVATETVAEAATTSTTNATVTAGETKAKDNDETGSKVNSEEANANALNGVWTYEANEDDGIQVSLTGIYFRGILEFIYMFVILKVFHTSIVIGSLNNIFFCIPIF